MWPSLPTQDKFDEDKLDRLAMEKARNSLSRDHAFASREQKRRKVCVCMCVCACVCVCARACVGKGDLCCFFVHLV